MTQTDRNGILISISRVYANVNEEKGPKWYDHRQYTPVWKPPTGYYLIKNVGRGKYSTVYKGLYQKKKDVAVKILVPTSSKNYLKEVMILDNLLGGPNIVQQTDTILDPHTGIYSLVSEWVEFHNWSAIYFSLTVDDSRLYLYKLLVALDYSHRNGIMHRDIKPANIAINKAKEELRLLDWGLAEFYHPQQKNSPNVGTPSFKPPEACMEYPYYDYSFDIWSSGITLAIMLFKKVLIKTGRESDDQLLNVAELVGGQKIIDYAKSLNMPLDSYLVKDLKKKKGTGWEFYQKQWPDKCPPDALDLLNLLTEVDHRKRITAREAMAHPFFKPILHKLNENERI